MAARCLGIAGEPDYEAVKKWIIFTPKQFCDMILNVRDMQICLVWDDAGFWLNRLFWYEQFVREALRYMTLQRTQFASILFSTPSLTLLSNKILELEDVYRVKIYKVESDFRTPISRPRLAWVKKPWYSDDQSKHGVATKWRERFTAMMPDDFYQWYEPVRKGYTVLAAQRIRDAIERASDKPHKKEMLEVLESEIDRSIPSVETVKEVGEVNKQLQTS